MTIHSALMILGSAVQVYLAPAVIGQGGQPPCMDPSTEKKSEIRNPYRILLGTFPNANGWVPPPRWDQLLDCEVETYEDANCTQRYVAGVFWNASHAQRMVDYLVNEGIPAEMFVFAYQNRRIIGWGNWIDFGQRIE